MKKKNIDKIMITQKYEKKNDRIICQYISGCIKIMYNKLCTNQ